MPIQHAAPYLDQAQVKITGLRMDLQREMLFLTFCHGDTVDGVFVPGPIEPQERLIRDIAQVLDNEGGEVVAADPVYSNLVATSAATADDEASPGDGGYNCYVGTARNLYAYAIAQGWYEGEIL